MIHIREAIKFGWKGFKKNWKPFTVLALLVVVVTVLSTDEAPLSIKSFLGQVGMAIVALGGTVLSLKVVDGRKVGFSDIGDSYKDFKLLTIFVLVSITYGILFQLGLVLLIIPGLFIGARLFAAPYLVIDKNASYIDSFKRSWKLTQGKTIKLMIFQIVMFGLIILGLLVLVVGVLAAFGVISIASAYVY
ncbi:MAG: hypothetical protein WD992_01005, partial [Candidatus Levyibacteriota bacterium]